MKETFERYTIAPEGDRLRITFDQRRNALVNIACGLVLALAGYVWEDSFGTVLLWIGIGWAVLAGKAYSSERETELGNLLICRTGRKERTMPRSDVSELVLRLRSRPKRSQKQSVLPWEVQIWGAEKRPFATFSFQDEKPAREFIQRIGHALGEPVVERLQSSNEVNRS